jgi:hypothetical protein
VPPPEEAVASYAVIALPPSFFGFFHDTVAL